jgi:hypothetical protein
MKFEIGQKVWLALWDSTTNYVTCPDCGGTGRIRVIHHDDTMMSVECAGCQSGYDPPKGYLKVYDRHAKAELVTITGVHVSNGKIEWRSDRSWLMEESDLFETKEGALTRAVEKAAVADKEDRDRIQAKEKPTRTWSWNAHYHRREIKKARRQIEYHEKKLAVANLKVKPEKTAALKDQS